MIAVHLFDADRLVVNLRVQAAGPQDYYQIEGVTYQVIDRLGPFLDSSGYPAWDLQVQPTRSHRLAKILQQ